MNPSPNRFRRRVAGIGELCLRPLCVEAHAACAHRWLASDHARFWGMQALSAADVADYFRQIDAAETHAAFIGLHDGTPAFLVECYDPAAEPVGTQYAVAEGDRGMHVLVAPPTRRLPRFTWAVFALIMDWLFADPAVERVVVEPDTANAGIHPLNRRAGFVYHRQIALPGKTAWLATCTRSNYTHALGFLDERQAEACGRTAACA